MMEPILTNPAKPNLTRTEPRPTLDSLWRLSVIRELILERQKQLNQRLEALQAAAHQDNGGYYPPWEINPLAEEMLFLAKLARAHLEDLQERLAR